MKKIKRFFKIIVFVLMILLAFAGIGLPTRLQERDRESFHKEQKDEKEEDDFEMKEVG